MPNIPDFLEGVSLPLVHTTAYQLGQLISDVEEEVRHSIFDSPTPSPHIHDPGQSAAGRWGIPSDPPTNMDDLRTRATCYIQMEEIAKFHNSVYVGNPQPRATTRNMDIPIEQTRRARTRGRPKNQSIKSSPTSTPVECTV
ncbi:hypothetical protein CR513_17060, partial [Mucuna pruriens]